MVITNFGKAGSEIPRITGVAGSTDGRSKPSRLNAASSSGESFLPAGSATFSVGGRLLLDSSDMFVYPTLLVVFFPTRPHGSNWP